MQYKIVWLVAALRELEDIKSYIEQDNAAAARNLVDQILIRVGLLAEMLGIGSLDGEILELRYTVVKPNYSVYYRVEEKSQTIFIAHVWHNKRDKKVF